MFGKGEIHLSQTERVRMNTFRRGAFLIFLMGGIPILYLSGCNSGEYLHTRGIPTEIIFNGKAYKSTEKVIAIERIPNEVSFIGQGYWKTTLLTETPDQSESTIANFDVYSIQGTDSDKSIAIKILFAGTKTHAYYYYRYDRKLP